jgi:hypothetical protein
MSTVKRLFAVALMLGTAGPAFAGSYTLPLDARVFDKKPLGQPHNKFTGTVGYVKPIDAIDEIVPNVANPSLGGNTLSAEEVTPPRISRHLYNYGGDDNVTTWLGIAASSNGRVFQNIDRSGEVVARDSAQSQCEQTTGRTCRAIAVPVSWQVAVVSCRQAGAVAAFVGGSAQNASERIALDKGNKAGFYDRNCRTIYSK